MTIDENIVNEILNDYGKFTKEEYEVVNTYNIKNEAKYEKERFKLIGQTKPEYFVKRKYVDKYIDVGLRHKELLLNNSLEEFNAHKEVVLQCLSILQSLVNNPNVLDTLANILDGNWYGGQDFKQYLTSIINNELNKMNEIHTEAYNLRNCPAILYLPELYATESSEISKLPAYDTPQSRIENYTTLTNNNYPLLP